MEGLPGGEPESGALGTPRADAGTWRAGRAGFWNDDLPMVPEGKWPVAHVLPREHTHHPGPGPDSHPALHDPLCDGSRAGRPVGKAPGPAAIPSEGGHLACGYRVPGLCPPPRRPLPHVFRCGGL